jgi:hypothetical protein
MEFFQLFDVAEIEYSYLYVDLLSPCHNVRDLVPM